MNSRRLSALVLSLLALAGCHEDPQVLNVAVAASVTALSVTCSGGTASSSPGVDGTGGAGGTFSVTASGLISLGSPAFVPAVPSAPTPPSTFASTPVSPLPAATTSAGSIHLTGVLAASGAVTVTVTSTNGDIVFDGLLQAGDSGGGTQTNIVLNAPNGTVYIQGTIQTFGNDALSNGRAGGNLTISAARVVITGPIDTHGVANTTLPGINGGKGGDIDLSSTVGPIFVTSGAITTTGGAVVDTAASVSIRGGDGGFLRLNSAAEVSDIFVFVPVNLDGGAATGNGTTPQGGKGGDITTRGTGEINFVASLSMAGGVTTGTNMDAVGGNGGTLTVNGRAACRIYGTLTLGGGAGTASVTGGSVTGGNGGSVLLGQIAPALDLVELGQGTYSMAGGTGQLSTGVGGGVGGSVAVESLDGDISVESSLSTAGGAGTGAGNSSGAAAGNQRYRTDFQASGNVSNHTLSIPSLASLLDASGGAALGTGTGGAGGNVLLQCGGDLTSGARIQASGGSSVNGVGGATTPITPVIAGVDPTSAVVFRVAATNIAPTGGLNAAGEIHTQGGSVSTGGSGGNGASITMLIAAGSGSLQSLGLLVTSGGVGVLGAAGSSGSLFFTSQSGNLDVTGTLTVSGANSPTVPTVSGNVTARSGGILTFGASVLAVGGSSTDANGLVSGRKGGAILLDGTSVFASVTLVAGFTIQADGGSAPGTSVATLGGAGGSITMQTRGQFISLAGGFLARGGPVSGTGTGGLGGQVVANSDFTGGGTAGDITLQFNGGIDVSGGTGSLGGSAQQNGVDPGTALANPPVNLAVVFDANNGLGGTGGGAPGKVINNGTITAAGGGGTVVGAGGDVYFDGLNASGVTLTLLDAGSQNRAGTPAGQFYPH